MLEFEKNYCHFRKQYPWIFQYAKIHAKIKKLTFRTKAALFGYFWTGIRKSHCHIWNQHPEFVYLQNFVKKRKCLYLEPTISVFLGWNSKILLSYLKSASSNFSCIWCKKNSLSLGPKMLEILKDYCHIWNQHPQICQTAKFLEKMKMSKFGTKNALFGIFWLEFENNILIFEISTLNFIKLQNFLEKWKCLNLGPKMPYLGIFGL